MMRSIGAIIAGFVFIAVLSFGSDQIIRHMSPRAFDAAGGTHNLAILLLSTVYVAVFATVGSYLAARLAPDNPMRHALILGALGLIFSIVMTMQAWELTPAWYNILNLALVMPYAWLGGHLREGEIDSSPAPMGAPTRATA